MLHTNSLANPVACVAYIVYPVPGLLYQIHVKIHVSLGSSNMAFDCLTNKLWANQIPGLKILVLMI